MYTIFADSTMKSSLFWVFFLVKHCQTLIDVNIHELQYVSDHLTYQECRRLSAALHLSTWDLPKNVTGSGEPAAPCLVLLLRYDIGRGRGKTYHDLGRRIQQIGRTDISKRLSSMVLHKKAEAIQKDFLDDPFRKKIRVTPFLLNNSPEDDEDDIVGNDENEDDNDNAGKNEDDSNDADMNEDDINTKELIGNTSSKSSIKWSVSVANHYIVLVSTALFAMFILSVTFCIFGCPRCVKNCYRCCMPRPLAECMNDVCAFIRVDLADYLKEVCRKKSALETDDDLEMREKLLRGRKTQNDDCKK